MWENSYLIQFCITEAECKKETLFITGGKDTCILEMMDEAMKAMKAHMNESINMIGIMKWDDVHGNDKLIQKTKRILVRTDFPCCCVHKIRKHIRQGPFFKHLFRRYNLQPPPRPLTRTNENESLLNSIFVELPSDLKQSR